MEDSNNSASKKSSPINSGVILAVVIAIIVIGAGIAFIANSQSTTAVPESTTEQAGDAMQTGSQESTSTNPDSSAMETGNETAGEVRMIDVEGGSFYYKPAEIRLKKGEKVRIVMKSVSMMHDFVIDELNVKMPITKSGETGTVEFVADQVGEFEYYCSVGQHRANGMVGKLIVEE